MFESNVLLLLIGALVGYGIALVVLLRLAPERAHIYAATLVALALAVYWMWFDHALHADHRYYLRTVLLLVTPVLGAVAAVHALWADGELAPIMASYFVKAEPPHPNPLPSGEREHTALAAAVCTNLDDPIRGKKALKLPLWSRLGENHAAAGNMIRAAAPALALVLLVHAVETAKFVQAWSSYKAAVRALATGTASDPELGDPRFVSADRIGATLNRLSWNSTTLYLSVLLAPGFAPSRLVIDPMGNYFWLTCRTATANEEADRAVPVETRRLLRIHACQHRQ
jgi:hypothetical protein